MEGVPVIAAWHKGQDGLLHKAIYVEPRVPIRLRSGPNTGERLWADRVDTACGWSVFAKVNTANSIDKLHKGVPTCLECAVVP